MFTVRGSVTLLRARGRQLWTRSAIFKDALAQSSSGVEAVAVETPGSTKGRWKRLQETFVTYWKGVYTDYCAVAKDVLADSKERPVKALTYVSTLGFLGYCVKLNPNERDFHDASVYFHTETLLVPPTIRSKRAEQYVRDLASLENAQLLRFFNCGIFTVAWMGNMPKHSGLYAAQCRYTMPKWTTFEWFFDIGFLGRWWRLERMMKDYDVNEEEWAEESSK